MRLREHIFNLFARADIPFGHVVIKHFLLVFFPVFLRALCDLALTDGLHYIERFDGFKPHVHKIGHNAVTGTDNV